MEFSILLVAAQGALPDAALIMKYLCQLSADTNAVQTDRLRVISGIAVVKRHISVGECLKADGALVIGASELNGLCSMTASVIQLKG